MRTMSPGALVCILAAALTGCGEHKPEVPQPAQQQPAQTEPARSDGHNAENSLDWFGTYEGVVPCADCEGIKTVVTLNNGMTYSFSATYLGKPGKPFEHTGTFAWNESGNTVVLADLDNRPNKYFVGEGYLLQLDMEGRKIEGALASRYTLKKQEAARTAGAGHRPLQGTTWHLKVIMGKEVTTGPDEKRPFILLEAAGNRVNGFAGCNTFAGTYEAQDPDRLSFSQVAATRMMCRDMDVETMLFEALGKADSYAIRENRLMLHRARTAPLAEFEASPAE